MLFLRILRFEAWVSKIPGFFAAAFVVVLYRTVPLSALLWSVGFLLTHLCTGYVINDLADWDSDLASGDGRAVHRLGKQAGLFVLALLTGLHLLVCAQIAAADPRRWLLLLGLTGLHFVYSIPPRLKGRGIWGVLSSAVNQWVAPFTALVVQTGLGELEAVLLVWLFLVGVNGAVRHQIHDYQRDSLGEVQTFVQRVGLVQAVRLLYRVQRSAIGLPLLLLVVLPLPQALVALVDVVGFTVYHTLYYKRLRVANISSGEGD